MENARKLNLFSSKYLPVKNNLLMYLIKQLFYSIFLRLADYKPRDLLSEFYGKSAPVATFYSQKGGKRFF